MWDCHTPIMLSPRDLPIVLAPPPFTTKPKPIKSIG